MIRQPHFHRALLALLLALSAAPFAWSQAPDDADRRAFLTVRVQENAKLTVDGTTTKQRGGVRRFYSPPLEPGKGYFYLVVAEWMPNNYETFTVKRKVEVAAGKRLEIDLRKPNPELGDTLFIRWVATPPKVIDGMMKLAGVGKDDVVYDLGCGRGEIVVAAVKKFKAKRGVGIDLDAEQVQKAKLKALEAGVEDQVEIRQGDVLQVKDLANATVVTLYMSDDLNKLLMPILKKQLKPGARIVSHRFTMGDWKPDKTETVDIELEPGTPEEEKLIHLWKIEKKE